MGKRLDEKTRLTTFMAASAAGMEENYGTPWGAARRASQAFQIAHTFCNCLLREPQRNRSIGSDRDVPHGLAKPVTLVEAGEAARVRGHDYYPGHAQSRQHGFDVRLTVTHPADSHIT